MKEPLDVSVEGPVVAQPIPELITGHPIDGQAVDPTISEQIIRRGVRWSRHILCTSQVGGTPRSREGDVDSP